MSMTAVSVGLLGGDPPPGGVPCRTAKSADAFQTTIRAATGCSISRASWNAPPSSIGSTTRLARSRSTSERPWSLGELSMAENLAAFEGCSSGPTNKAMPPHAAPAKFANAAQLVHRGNDVPVSIGAERLRKLDR